MNAPVAIECCGLSLDYAGRNRKTAALHDVSLTLARHEFVSIVGPSGCGKTTLLKLLARLLAPDAGTVSLHGEPEAGRLPCAFVFQDHCVFPWLSVLDNVAFGLEFHRLPRGERHRRARAFIEQFGLGAFAEALPHELSVGMRQRVSLARAFVADPQLLLLDEPFASLDALTRLVLQDELLRLWTERRATIVYVTHDLAEAVLLSDRVLVMSGRPGTIRMDVPIPLPRPRNLLDRADERVVEIERRLWQSIEAEVRAGLNVAESGR